MSPNRVLIVSYYFPPIGGIGSIRMASFAAHLAEFGWTPTVIAPRRTPHPPGADLDPSVRVVRSTSLEAGRLLARVAPSLVYPDAQIGWYPGAVMAGSRLVHREVFDAVLSSAFPITAHLAARTLSRRAGLPWVAEFRDPWSDRLGAGHPHHDRAVALEQDLAGSATQLIMPSPSWAARYGGIWRREVEVVPNGHDGEVARGPVPTRPTITHTGMFYPGAQSLTVLWSAIRRLLDAGSLEAPVLRFVGDVPGQLRSELGEFGLERLVEETGFVSHRTAIDLMSTSTMLIASGYVATDPIAQGVVPAKLFEYLATSLPIIYVGSRRSDAARLLEPHDGCHIVGHDDVEAAVGALESGLAAAPLRRDVESLSRRNRAHQLALILDAAAGS